MKKIFILFLCIFYTPNLLSTTIRVVNFQQLVDQNKDLVQLVSLIETDQIEHRKIFFNKELKLNSRLEEIEELKLILEENQLKIESGNETFFFFVFLWLRAKFWLHFGAHFEGLFLHFFGFLVVVLATCFRFVF